MPGHGHIVYDTGLASYFSDDSGIICSYSKIINVAVQIKHSKKYIHIMYRKDIVDDYLAIYMF